jgi:hypothetical protein
VKLWKMNETSEPRSLKEKELGLYIPMLLKLWLQACWGESELLEHLEIQSM